MKTFKCPNCIKKYVEKAGLYEHIEKVHKNIIPDNISASQYYFNIRNNKLSGSCVICGNKTDWNEATERYERFCSERCKEDYREEFKKRMLDKYGKTHLLNDPNQQKKMLQNRSISGTYHWSDGKTETGYTGSYEHDFLKFLDVFLQFNPTDIISPAPQVFYYNDEDGTKRFYIPDFYIPSINTLIEIKDGGDNPNNHHNRQNIDGRKEKIKDDLMRNQKQYNFVKVTDKNYSIFLDFLVDVKNNNIDESKKEKTPVIKITESMDIIEGKLLQKLNESGGGQKLYHISKSNLNGKTLHPRIPDNYLTNNGFEENRTARISFAKDIDGCLIGMSSNLKDQEFFIHEPIDYSIIKTKNINNNDVPDASLTGEVWVLTPTKLKVVGKIKVHEAYEKPLKYKYGNHEAETYKWRWSKIHLKVLENTVGAVAPIAGPNATTAIKQQPYDMENINEGEINYDGINNRKLNPVIKSLPELDEMLNNSNRIWLNTDWRMWQFKDGKVNKISEVDSIIKTHNQYVQKNDAFIYLGDLVDSEFEDKKELIKIIKSLNGRKIIVLGNNDIFDESFYHDCGFEFVLEGFKWRDYLFTHYPINNKSKINFHGHLHGGHYYENNYKNHADLYNKLNGFRPQTLSDMEVKYNMGFCAPRVMNNLKENTKMSFPHYGGGIDKKTAKTNMDENIGSGINNSWLVAQDDIEDNQSLSEFNSILESYTNMPFFSLSESFKIDGEGSMIINLREKSDFMSKYNTSHRLLKIYMETNNVEGVKHELCKLWYMYIVIEAYYNHKTRKKLIPFNKQQEQEALKAKAFILNDFTNGMRWISKREPNFNFDEYFSETPYNKDILKISESEIKGIKKFLSSLLV